jgi:hypothetical protein
MPYVLSIAVTLLAMLPLAATAAAAPSESAALAVSTDEQLALAPDVAVGPGGEIAVLWLAKGNPESAAAKAAAADRAKHGHTHLSSMNLYVAVSKDGGASFSAPLRVNREDNEVWGFAVSRPRVAYGPGGTLHIAYPANEMQPDLGKPVLTSRYTRSTDGGASFEVPRRLSTVTDADLANVIHGGFASVAAFGTMGVAPNGDVHLVWIDTRDMTSGTDNASIYGVVSHDDGRTFTQDRVEAAGGVCPCCQLTLAFDSASRPVLGSRLVTPEGVRASTVARADGKDGAFGERVSTGGAPWKIDGCPLKPTVLAVRGDTIYTAVHNGAEQPAGVLLATSRNGGASFNAAQAAHPGAQVSDAPAIALAARDRAVVAWHAKTDGPRQIFYRTLDASGQPLDAPNVLTSGDETAQHPALASRPDGRVQIAWQQGQRIYTSTIDPAE